MNRFALAKLKAAFYKRQDYDRAEISLTERGTKLIELYRGKTKVAEALVYGSTVVVDHDSLQTL